MHWESALTTTAEVGIGIAGFSGVFVAIARRNSQDWSPRQAVALDVLLFASGAALFASLLLDLGLSASSAWAVASLIYGLWLAGITAFRLRQSPRAGTSVQTWAVVVGFLVAALVLANAAWFHTSSLDLLAVYWQLFVAFFSFILLLRDVSGPEQRAA